MALTAALTVLSSLALCAYSAPLDAPLVIPSTTQFVVVTQIVTSNVQILETSTVLIVPSSPVLPAPPLASSAGSEPTLPPPSPPPPAPTTSSSGIASTETDFVTVTATFTPPPLTVTVWDPPTTTTETVTESPSATDTPAGTVWSAPAQMTDLSCFKVSHFAYGQDNFELVTGVPASAIATTLSSVAPAAPSPIGPLNSTESQATPNAAAELPLPPSSQPPPPPPPQTPGSPSPQSPSTGPPAWDNSSVVMQLLYPAGSSAPSSKPQGGADFYAAPLDLHAARNVTLAYSVFFPVDFDWVLAGKLPGIYGGHETCSGGDDALSCFSTRLMWRAGGLGELYLYAPKDKQTAGLCSTPPLSLCDADYGLSIGRGAFNFTPGAWTHVRQTVALNTPGKQDGEFVLEVNGQEVIRRDDVFYRDVPRAPPPPPPEDEGPDDSDNGGGDGDGDGEDGDGNGNGEDGGDDGSDQPEDPEKPEPTQDPSSSDGPASPPSSPTASAPSPSVTPPQDPTPPAPPPSPPSPPPSSGLGDLPILGPLLGSLDALKGGPVLKRQIPGQVAPPLPSVQPTTSAGTPPPLVPTEQQMVTATTTVAPQVVTQTAYSPTSTSVAIMDVQPTPNAVHADASGLEPVGFTGLFFSTFFGGHEDKYASPRDQYTWFKDFAMTING